MCIYNHSHGLVAGIFMLLIVCYFLHFSSECFLIQTFHL